MAELATKRVALPVAIEVEITDAVRCRVCGKIHEKGGGSYIMISGWVVVDVEKLGRNPLLWIKHLGRPETPTVICRGEGLDNSQECLLSFMGLLPKLYDRKKTRPAPAQPVEKR